MPGVYISYPFCAQKCTYCNFASGVFPEALAARYIQSLRAELRATKWQWTPETVYLGGGTPSQMEPEALASLLDEIPGRPWLESTIEAAPCSITPKKAAAWRRIGIDRVSLGVQSFVTRELARTGRKHTAEIVETEVTVLRDAGIHAINIDLIAGLPGQTRQSWDESLKRLVALGVPHASIYMLEVDEDSRLGQEVLTLGSRYGAPDVPMDDAIADFYEMAVERLTEAGLARYEISNFALPGCESRHNLKYWRREPYLGFGADAHSFDGVWRRQNAESASQYIEGGSAPEPILADPVSERFFLGLRLTDGIEEDSAPFSEAIERLVREGLLESDGNRLRLTDRGVLLSNEVFSVAV